MEGEKIQSHESLKLHNKLYKMKKNGMISLISTAITICGDMYWLIIITP